MGKRKISLKITLPATKPAPARPAMKKKAKKESGSALDASRTTRSQATTRQEPSPTSAEPKHDIVSPETPQLPSSPPPPSTLGPADLEEPDDFWRLSPLPPGNELTDKQGSESSDSDEGSPLKIDPTSSKRKRGRPKKELAPPAVLPQPIFSLPIFVEIEMPARWVKGASTKKPPKLEKQKPISRGPSNISDAISWDSFLEEVSQLSVMSKEKIQVDKMSWRFSNGNRNYPLTTSEGLRTMLNQAKALSSKSPIVMVCLPAPLAEEAARDLPPWAQPAMDGPEMPFRSEDGPGSSSSGRTPALDEVLAPIVEALIKQNPIGRCPRHPTMRCYIYGPKDWHFELDTNRLNVWASAIHKVKTDIDLPPLESVFFRPNQVIGYRRGHGPEPSNQLATPVPSQLNPYAMPSFPMPQTPFHPMYYNTGAFMPSLFTPPSGPSPQPIHTPFTPAPRSGHPPSSPILGSTSISVKEFCALVKLDAHVLSGLESLGFEIGDKVEGITDAQWSAVGIKPFEWARFVERYGKFKKGYYN